MSVGMVGEKASRIDLFTFSTPPMRAFHMSWMAFFTAFFAWFGVAPLMPVIREELGLAQTQVGNVIVASVAGTVLMRLLVGPLCDRLGPRVTYAGLLILAALPVMGIGLARSYEAFLLLRLAIGAIGAAFVITQYHTSVMFAPRCVGTANATTAGWGNLGGGIAQIAMPLLLGGIMLLGVPRPEAWRFAMLAPGAALLLMGVAYYTLTQDTPAGNYRALRRTGRHPAARRGAGFTMAARDPRVWGLFLLYAACFGVELTIHNVGALYFHDRFGLGLASAGLLAGLYGAMNVVTRTLGGLASDRAARRWGLPGRVRLLCLLVLAEGIALIVFSRAGMIGAAVVSLLACGIFAQMASGATFGVVPFVNPVALGAVAGIVGAGGNVGAVAAGFLFGVQALPMATALTCLGVAVCAMSAAAILVRFGDGGASAPLAAPAMGGMAGA